MALQFTIGLLTILLILDLGSNPVQGGSDNKPKKCQEITIPMCRGIGYNQTYMPNQFNHDTQVGFVLNYLKRNTCKSSSPHAHKRDFISQTHSILEKPLLL